MGKRRRICDVDTREVWQLLPGAEKVAMVTLRCTQALLRHLRRTPDAEPPASTAALGEWYGALVQVGRRKLVVFLDEHARLPVILTGEELRRLPESLAGRLALVLAGCGVSPAAARAECQHFDSVAFARTKSRSHVGSLNEFVSNIQHRLRREPATSALMLSLDLAEMPLLGPLKGQCAREAVVERLGLSSSEAAPGPVQLTVLSVGPYSATCRPAGSGKPVLLRLRRPWAAVPGEVLDVVPWLTWDEGGDVLMVGHIAERRLDAAALSLEPLRLADRGLWDPSDEEWCEPGEPLPDWARATVAWGPRRAYEMEQILPGVEWDDPDSDPISQANDLRDAGHFWPAYELLMGLCLADLRCLDAHAHLGNLMWNMGAERALPHYEVGVRIGDLSLGDNFDGVLPWGWIDNRPFLRCLYNYGLCLWRLERFDEAAMAFSRALWLNPTDNQGARFVIDAVRRRHPWTPDV